MAQKKAKLAHEKKASQALEGSPLGQFTFAEVVELVEWPKGRQAAVVDLDGNGTKAIVDRHFVVYDPADGEAKPSRMACPALYDEVARQRALEAYQQYANQ